MWSGLPTLLLLSTTLAISSLLAGLLPLVYPLSRRHVKLLAACGAGILMGTALIVIIPEGVEALYNVSPPSGAVTHTAHARSTAEITGAWAAQIPSLRDTDEHQPARYAASIHHVLPRHSGAELAVEEPEQPVDSGLPSDGAAPEVQNFEPHAWVGISLISGFLLMYLIDKGPQLITSPAKLQPAYISLGSMALRRGSTATDTVADHRLSPVVPQHAGFGSSSTTTGLVIHAMADGIAFGASSASASANLSLVIFFALMIHKAPAAFGLTTILLKQGLSKRSAKAHLLVFSFAAPAGALVTWVVANVIGGSAIEPGSTTTFVTALLLLFSGGTFLYVAMHTLQDSDHAHSKQEQANADGYGDMLLQQATDESAESSSLDFLATIAGMLLPLLTQVNHSH